MNNLLVDAESIETAKLAINQLREILLAGGCPLRKWASNHADVRPEIPDKHWDKNKDNFFDEEAIQRVMGIFWSLKKDTIQIRAIIVDEVQTKRELLSIITKIMIHLVS